VYSVLYFIASFCRLLAHFSYLIQCFALFQTESTGILIWQKYKMVRVVFSQERRDKTLLKSVYKFQSQDMGDQGPQACESYTERCYQMWTLGDRWNCNLWNGWKFNIHHCWRNFILCLVISIHLRSVCMQELQSSTRYCMPTLLYYSSALRTDG